MATSKNDAVDTSLGRKAYGLLLRYQAELKARVPSDIAENLVADLAILGADPNPPAVVDGGVAPLPLQDALANAVVLMTAVFAAIHGAKPKAEVRKAYGVSSKPPRKEPKAVIEVGQKMLDQARKNPGEALSLGVLPADMDALDKAIRDLEASEKAAKGAAKVPVKVQSAAISRMHEATARISGAGELAFATNASVRAEFQELAGKKSA